MSETRQGAIAHHIRTAIAHSGLSLRSYATAVAAHYLASVPLHARGVAFHDGGDVHADQKANAQLISRMVDGTVRMPIELEESLILSLPISYQKAAQRELAERLGLLAAPLPSSDGARDHVAPAELMRETGEALTALAAIISANGRAALADTRRAVKELRDVQAMATSLIDQLVTATAQGDTPATNVRSLRQAGAA